MGGFRFSGFASVVIAQRRTHALELILGRLRPFAARYAVASAARALGSTNFPPAMAVRIL